MRLSNHCYVITGSHKWQQISMTHVVCFIQVAANTKGIQLVQELIGEHSLTVVQAYMAFIQANAGGGGASVGVIKCACVWICLMCRSSLWDVRHAVVRCSADDARLAVAAGNLSPTHYRTSF